MDELSEYLLRKFLEWQLSTGKKQSMSAWAKHLNVKYSSLVGWVNGTHPPEDQNISLLAGKLGYEIYDIMGKPRPDPILTKLKDLKDSDEPEVEELWQMIEAWLGAHGFLRTK